MTKKRKLSKMQLLNNEIEKSLNNLALTETKIDEIYFEIINMKECSNYKKILLTQKMNLLALQLCQDLDKSRQCYENKSNLYIKEQKRRIITIVILFIIAVLIPIIGTIGWLYAMVIVDKVSKNFKDDSIQRDISQLEYKCNTFKNVFQNCETFLNKANKKYNEKKDLKMQEDFKTYLEVDVANRILEDFLERGEFIRYPENINKILIELLQQELQTKEESLEKLLEMAKDKITVEKLHEELDLTINLTRNKKN